MKQSSLVSQSSFTVVRREKLLNYKTYSAEAEDLISRIPKAEGRLNDPAWLADKDAASLMRLTGARAEYALNLLTLQYSAGVPVPALRALFVSTIDYFETYAKYNARYNEQQGPTYKSPHITLTDSEFHDANRLVCFSILLGTESMLSRVAALIDYDCPKADGMLDHLLALYLHGRSQSNECTRHLPYYKTLKIFGAAPGKREALMADYLTDWYTASRREPYYDSHKRGEEFRGYWSWEAGAITVALDIDDSGFRDMEFYPRDLVDFSREAKRSYSPPDAPPLNSNELRAKAGEPCPKAGLWQSLDIPPKAKHYELEQPMEDLGSAYGLTVWRLTEDY